MDKTGPIIIIDDDKEDLEIFHAAFLELNLPNQILLFNAADAFLEFLKGSEVKLFFILCDINMPMINGFVLRDQLYADISLRNISIPFIFFSTTSDFTFVAEAYKKPIQGYFQKPSSYDEIKSLFITIIQYWSQSFHPIHPLFKF